MASAYPRRSAEATTAAKHPGASAIWLCNVEYAKTVLGTVSTPRYVLEGLARLKVTRDMTAAFIQLHVDRSLLELDASGNGTVTKAGLFWSKIESKRNPDVGSRTILGFVAPVESPTNLKPNGGGRILADLDAAHGKAAFTDSDLQTVGTRHLAAASVRAFKQKALTEGWLANSDGSLRLTDAGRAHYQAQGLTRDV